MKGRDAEVPHLLEHPGYQPVTVTVPAMQGRCYDVVLARTNESTTSHVTSLSAEGCKCEMFTGKTIWPKR